MPQATADAPGALLGQNTITTNATPAMGRINIYNGALGLLTPVLRQAALVTLGTTTLVEIDPNDTSGRPLVVTCYSGESFVDRTTTRVLTEPGSFLVLSPTAVPVADGGDGIARWKVVGGNGPSIGGLTIANYDGGSPSSVYDASLNYDGGSPSSVYDASSFTIGGGTP